MREKLVLGSWFVALLLVMLSGLYLFHKGQLANAAFQQLLWEKSQALQRQQIQLNNEAQARGMIPQPPVVEEEVPEEK